MRTLQEIDNLVLKLCDALTARRWLLCTAESCTGGFIAQVITALSGSSTWFDRGFVTYSNEAKIDMLGVDAELIAVHGAVSGEVAHAMSEGALAHSMSQLAVAVTGIAGPTGGSVEKPVGTVWFGWSNNNKSGQVITHTECVQFSGDRQAVRMQAVYTALQGCLTHLQ